MDALDRHAELIKLGRLLAVDPAELTFLGEADPGSLRGFREAATHTLFDDGRETFRRLAQLGRLLPIPLLVRFTAAMVGPELAARVASEMDPERASKLSSSLPLQFLKEVSIHLEPGRSREVVRGIDPDQVRAVTLALLADKEYVCMARFVDVLAEPVLQHVITAIESEAALLQIGFFVEDKAQLNMLIGLFADVRLERMIIAAHENDLWPQAIAMMSHVSDSSCTRLGDITAARPDEMLTSLVRAARKDGLLALLLGVVSHMSQPGQRRVAQLDVLAEAGVIEDLVGAAVDAAQWEAALTLLPMLPTAVRCRAEKTARQRGIPMDHLVSAAAPA